MFYKIILTMKRFLDNTTILMIIAVGLFTLLVDGKRYKDTGYIKELKLVKLISYSYMTIGGLMYILLLLM